jgi:quercetin dioxygenase-like cupin family protein
MTFSIAPTTRYVYSGVNSAIYMADTGQGLLRHEHTFAHTTVCIQGKMVVRKEDKEIELTPLDSPLLLTAHEWHEVEALEPNTIFMNQSPVSMGEV